MEDGVMRIKKGRLSRGPRVELNYSNHNEVASFPFELIRVFRMIPSVIVGLIQSSRIR